LEFKAMSRYGDVSQCWLEVPDGAPTDGQLCAESGEKCDVDANADGHVGDGNCMVTQSSEESDIYSVADVTCNSPTLIDPETKKAIVNEKVPVLVKCRNTFGVERTLGETSFYVFGPGAPQILVPPEFSMGWFQENGRDIVAFDKAIVSGTGYGYNCTSGSTSCEVI